MDTIIPPDPALREQLAVADLRQVRAWFATSQAMADAAEKLSLAGFDRADLGLPDAQSSSPALGVATAATSDDAQQARTLATSLAAAAGAMAAGAITVATGGAAAVAVVAAIAAGGGAGAVAGLVGKAASDSEQAHRDHKAATGDLILSVRTATPEKRQLAERILQEAGATSTDAD